MRRCGWIWHAEMRRGLFGAGGRAAWCCKRKGRQITQERGETGCVDDDTTAPGANGRYRGTWPVRAGVPASQLPARLRPSVVAEEMSVSQACMIAREKCDFHPLTFACCDREDGWLRALKPARTSSCLLGALLTRGISQPMRTCKMCSNSPRAFHLNDPIVIAKHGSTLSHLSHLLPPRNRLRNDLPIRGEQRSRTLPPTV